MKYAALFVLLAFVTACASKPDPVVVPEPYFPRPPEILMEPPQDFKTIEVETNGPTR